MESSSINHRNVYYPPGGILMWIIIFIELITFGSALVTMVYYGLQEIEVFHTSRLKLNASIGTINTLFLITSGYFMARSVGYLKNNDKDRSILFLKLTMLGGLLFLALKSVEYYFKIDEGLTVGHNTFFTFYWMLTLFHVIHVIVGLVILATVFFGLRKEKATVSIVDMEASAAFWHMCDLIWLLLFPIIYLLF